MLSDVGCPHTYSGCSLFLGPAVDSPPERQNFSLFALMLGADLAQLLKSSKTEQK